MKLVLLTNYDAASALALHYVSQQISTEQLSVFYTRQGPKPQQQDSPLSPLSELALFEQGLPEMTELFGSTQARELSKVNRPDQRDVLAQLQPDLILSIRHMTILKQPVIELPRVGVLNLHSGLLPNYQGVMATFWAMKNREPRIGTTVHDITDQTIDTGAVHCRSSKPVNYEKSYLWNTLNLYKQGCQNLMQTAATLLSSDTPVSGNAQQGAGRYYSFPSLTDLRSAEFKLFEPTDSLTEFLD